MQKVRASRIGYRDAPANCQCVLYTIAIYLAMEDINNGQAELEFVNDIHSYVWLRQLRSKAALVF